MQVSQASHPYRWGAAYGVFAALIGGIVFPLCFHLFVPADDLTGPALSTMGIAFGAAMGAFGVVFTVVMIKRVGAQSPVGSDTDLVRLRAARLALKRGELTDDAETNRIAAGMARGARRLSISPRFVLIVSVCGAVLQSTQLVLAIVDAHVARVVFFGLSTVLFVLVAAVGYPIYKRTLRRNERISALFSDRATASDQDGSDPRPPSS